MRKLILAGLYIWILVAGLPVDFLPVLSGYPLIRIIESIVLLCFLTILIKRYGEGISRLEIGVLVYLLLILLNSLSGRHAHVFKIDILVLDASVFIGFLTGLNTRRNEHTQILMSLYKISILLFLTGFLALRLGLMNSLLSNREVLLPMFVTAISIQTIGIYLYYSKKISTRVFLLGVVITLIYGVTSETRNVVLVSALSVLLFLYDAKKILIVPVILLLMVVLPSQGRLTADVDIKNESRFVELLLLFENFDRYFLGEGLGYGGIKPSLGVGEDIIVPHAHISIASLYSKTGVFYVTLLFWSLIWLTWNRDLPKRNALALLIFQTMLSGGWNIFHFYLIGICIQPQRKHILI